jgi:hypothetical protein
MRFAFSSDRERRMSMRELMTTRVERTRFLAVVAHHHFGAGSLERLLRFPVANRSLLAKPSSQEVKSWQPRVSSSRD